MNLVSFGCNKKSFATHDLFYVICHALHKGDGIYVGPKKWSKAKDDRANYFYWKKTVGGSVMNKWQITISWVVLVFVVGMCSIVGASDSRAFDDRRVVEKKSTVMEVSKNCTSIVIGESTFVIGSWLHEGNHFQTKLLDSAGNSLQRCQLRPQDRVYVKGVARKDGSLFAYIIQKRK